jgi:hypothetical protein
MCLAHKLIIITVACVVPSVLLIVQSRSRALAEEQNAIATVEKIGGRVQERRLFPRERHWLSCAIGWECDQVISVHVPDRFWASGKDQTDELIGALKKIRRLHEVIVSGPSQVYPNDPPPLDAKRIKAAMPSVFVIEI